MKEELTSRLPYWKPWVRVLRHSACIPQVKPVTRLCSSSRWYSKALGLVNEPLIALCVILRLVLVLSVLASSATTQSNTASTGRFLIPPTSLPEFVRFVPNGVPEQWVSKVGGDILLERRDPEQDGFYLTYRHGDLEYLFGPYLQRNTLTLHHSLLQSLEDLLQRRDAATYRYVRVTIGRVVHDVLSDLPDEEVEGLYDPLFRDAEMLGEMRNQLGSHELGSPIGIDALTRLTESLELMRAASGEASLAGAAPVVLKFNDLRHTASEKALERMPQAVRDGLRRATELVVWRKITGRELPPGARIEEEARRLELEEGAAALAALGSELTPSQARQVLEGSGFAPADVVRLAHSLSPVDLADVQRLTGFLVARLVELRLAEKVVESETAMASVRARADEGEELDPWEGRMLAEAMRSWADDQRQAQEQRHEQPAAEPKDATTSEEPPKWDPLLDSLLMDLRLGFRSKSDPETSSRQVLDPTPQGSTDPRADSPEEDPRGKPRGHLDGVVGGDPFGSLDGALDGRGVPAGRSRNLATSFRRQAGEILIREIERAAGMDTPNKEMLSTGDRGRARISEGQERSGATENDGTSGARSSARAPGQGLLAQAPPQLGALIQRAEGLLGTETVTRSLHALGITGSSDSGWKHGEMDGSRGSSPGTSDGEWQQLREMLVEAAGQQVWSGLTPGSGRSAGASRSNGSVSAGQARGGGRGPDAATSMGPAGGARGGVPGAATGGAGASSGSTLGVRGSRTNQTSGVPASRLQGGAAGVEPGGTGSGGGSSAKSSGRGDGPLPRLFDVDVPEFLQYLSPFGPFTDEVVEWLADLLGIDPELVRAFTNPIGYALEHAPNVLKSAIWEVHELGTQTIRMAVALVEGDLEGFGNAAATWIGAWNDLVMLNDGIVEAVQPLLSPIGLPFLRNGLMDSPSLVLVNPGGFLGVPVYYVNGINTTVDGANEDARALSIQVRRPVLLIYNRTEGKANDLAESVLDKAWLLNPLKSFYQHNPTTRQVTFLLYRARGRTSIVSHSQGCLIMRNALNTANAFSGGRVKQDVAWVATGNPLRDEAVYPKPAKYLSLRDPRDPVAQLVGLRLDPDGITSQDFAAHSFVDVYVRQISPSNLWPSGQEGISAAMEGLGLAPLAKSSTDDFLMGQFSPMTQSVVRSVLPASDLSGENTGQLAVLGYELMPEAFDQVNGALSAIDGFLAPAYLDGPHDPITTLLDIHGAVASLSDGLQKLDEFSWQSSLESRPQQAIQFLSSEFAIPPEGLALLAAHDEGGFLAWVKEQVEPLASAMSAGDRGEAEEWRDQYAHHWVGQIPALPEVVKAGILEGRTGVFREWLDAQIVFDTLPLQPSWIDWGERIREAGQDDLDEVVNGMEQEVRLLELERYR